MFLGEVERVVNLPTSNCKKQITATCNFNGDFRAAYFASVVAEIPENEQDRNEY